MTHARPAIQTRHALLLTALVALTPLAGAIPIGGWYGWPGCETAYPACAEAYITDCWGGPIVFAGASPHPRNWTIAWRMVIDNEVRADGSLRFEEKAAFQQRINLPVRIGSLQHVVAYVWTDDAEAPDGRVLLASDGKGCY